MTSVVRDERGAIAVITAFMAVFAVAILYAFIGNFEAIFFREGMQDAADAAALSTAVIHARSMNLIVLINIIMAALMAILIAIKLVEGLCVLGMVIAAALAWPTFGASLVIIPPLKSAQQTLENSYQTLKEAIDPILEILNQTSDVVAQVAPAVADGIVTAEIMNGNMAPADSGVAFGSGLTLPVEDDDFGVLCTKGGEELAILIAMPLDKLDPTGFVKEGLIAASHAMTGPLEGWFCGGGNSSPPTAKRTETRIFPRNQTMDTCESNEGDPDAQERACEERKQFEERSKPDPSTGQCGKDSNCQLNGEYEQRVALARAQCEPTSRPAPTQYWYELRDGRVDYTWDGNTWKRGEPEYDTPRAFPASLGDPPPPEARLPPCGPEAANPRIAVGYTMTIRNSDDVDEVFPVCSSEAPPSLPPGRGEPTTVTVEFQDVVHLLGCKKSVQVEVKFGKGPPPSGGDTRSPKKVLGSAVLGDESFRVRAFLHGSFESEKANRIVRVALHHRAESEVPLASLAGLGDVSVAAAEYFYDGPGERGDWMWNMAWRARIRRFRLPETGAGVGVEQACSALGDGCGRALGMLTELGDVIAH